MQQTERAATAGNDCGSPDNSQRFEYKTPATIAANARQKLEWYRELICDQAGAPLATIGNCRKMLRALPRLLEGYRRPRINANYVMVGMWSRDDDVFVSQLRVQFEKYGLLVGPRLLRRVLELYTDELRQKLQAELDQRKRAA